jgi:SAM-dependent methyltransferase
VTIELGPEDSVRAIRRYWDAHPIASDSVPFERGTPQFFEALYSGWRRRVGPALLEFVERCRGERVLEVGCGIGIEGRFLAEKGLDYWAIDLSRESLRLARRHFELANLSPTRFVNASAVTLPFPDGSFDAVQSIGVLHHVPRMEEACREVVRVTRPGGRVRVMLYNHASYHYLLVTLVVAPLVWLLLHVPGGHRLVRRAPAKLRVTYEICRDQGFSRTTILNISTDTSETGADNFNPHSWFVTEREMRRMFAGLEDYRFRRHDLKYFPIRALRAPVARRWGFFLSMEATKLPSQRARHTAPR